MKTGRSTGYFVKGFLFSIKNKLVYVLLFLYIWTLVNPVREVSDKLGVAVAPWIFPFLNNYWGHQLIFVLLAVCLFADAPWKNPNTEYVLARIGKQPYVLGQYLYIIIAAFLFVALTFIFSLVCLTPRLGWSSGWGTIIKTLSMTDYIYQTGVTIRMSSQVVLNSNAIKQTIQSASLQWGCICLIGMLTRTINAFFDKKPVGTVFILAITLLDFLTTNLLDYHFFYWSPVSLARLSVTGNKGSYLPSFQYALVFYLVVCICCIGCGVLYAKWEGELLKWKEPIRLKFINSANGLKKREH